MIKIILGSLFAMLLVSLIPAALALDGPVVNISETVTAAFNAVGTYKTTPSGTGSVTVAVPNSNDVLQYIRFNLSLPDNSDLTTRTNLQNNMSYRDTAWGSDYTIFVNTTNADPDTTYSVNHTNYGLLGLNISMNVTNNAGGEDFYDSDNIRGNGAVNILNVTINLSNPSTVLDLNGIVLRVQFNTSNTTNDSLAMNSYPAAMTDGAASGTVIPDDLDGDEINDTINWTGNLAAGKDVIIFFEAVLIEGLHLPLGTNVLDVNNATSGALGIGNDLGARVEFQNTSGTLTGLYIRDKFTRGPIRQGIDMSQNSTSDWNIRGFFDNPATADLIYNVTLWRLYNVTPSTGNVNETMGSGDWSGTAISAGSRKYTDWNYSSSSTRPFYAPMFQWHVEWDSSQPINYSGVINSTVEHVTMNRLDLTLTHQDITGTFEAETALQNLTLRQDVAMAGTSATGRYVEIVATIPNEDTVGNIYYLNANTTSVKVYYGNSTGGAYALGNSEIDSSNYTLTIANPTADHNGSVNITINNMDNTYINGSYANPIGLLSNSRSDQIRLEIQVYTPSNITTGKTFVFGGNATVISNTGTPITEDLADKTITSGVIRLLGYKQLWVEDTSKPTIVNASLVVDITGSGALDGIEVMDYIPSGTDFAMGNATVRFKYSNGSWVDLTNASAANSYLLNDKSAITLPDSMAATPWNYSHNATDVASVWNGTLHASEQLEINYSINTTAGSYVLPAMISGFDPITGDRLSTSVQGLITVVTPTAVAPLQITEGDLEQAKAVIVGKPALWIKSVEVYNPNPRATDARFEIRIFGDTGEAYAGYYNERGERVEESVAITTIDGDRYLAWDTRIGALETRAYEIRILTPPVLEVDRDVEILEKLEEKRVKLKMDIYLKSFAEEDYQNVKLNLPIPYGKLVRVSDAFGNQMAFTGGESSTTVMIPEMEAGGIKTVTVIYQESYPVIIVTPDRERYDLDSPVDLVILVINGGEKVNYPYLETEVYTPGMDLVYSSIANLESMEPLEKTEMTEKFVIPSVAPEGTYLATARFREDFAVIASGTGNFYVSGAFMGTGSQAVEALIIIVITLALVYFSYKRIRGLRGIQRPTVQHTERSP